MSELISTGARTIKKEQWTFEPRDNKWYAIIPFECEEKDDVIMNFMDSDEYVLEHKEDFDALNNGFTRKNECVITCDHKPKCDMLIEINKATMLRGEIIYHKNPETGQFLPEWRPDPEEVSESSVLAEGLGIINNIPIEEESKIIV